MIKQTLGLVIPALVLLAVPAYAADAQIVDSGGVEVLVKDISIDYGGILGSDKETEGIRVAQGEALITAKWIDIHSVSITGHDPDAKRMTVEILLKNGKKVDAALVRKGRMTLTGKSDLGDYTIDLEKVRKITVVP